MVISPKVKVTLLKQFTQIQRLLPKFNKWERSRVRELVGGVYVCVVVCVCLGGLDHVLTYE